MHVTECVDLRSFFAAPSVSTPPPPPPGCFTDDQVLDSTHTPPSPMRRRMWRRLGQQEGMDSWECARRAAAAGYPLFGLTSGEMYPAYGWQCWWVEPLDTGMDSLA